MNFQKAEFIKSAVSPEDFIRDGLPTVVFAGRSNVGKSSVINRLLNRKDFARVGATPGKTVHINWFRIDGKMYFVDLPGYGYAKTSKAEKTRWGRLIERFFSESGMITLGVVIVDLRHEPTKDDIIMSDWFKNSGLPALYVANKCDKLKNSEIEPSVLRVQKTLGIEDRGVIIPFSAEKGTGRDALAAEITRRASYRSGISGIER
ncbi:MAG: ribosome biogenesis GTP-binding protein YihA/YsxC [Oscillospiraceae bacterium]|nr:ribosome biogenesis GTP-binding protein YihA/YsxC [Oscillospiraceae bacterium]